MIFREGFTGGINYRPLNPIPLYVPAGLLTACLAAAVIVGQPMKYLSPRSRPPHTLTQGAMKRPLYIGHGECVVCTLHFRSIVLDYDIAISSLPDHDKIFVGGPLGNYSLAGFEMVLTRHVMHYIINYYLPSGLFVVVSWISFLVPADVLPGQFLKIFPYNVSIISHEYNVLCQGNWGSIIYIIQYDPFIHGIFARKVKA